MLVFVLLAAFALAQTAQFEVAAVKRVEGGGPPGDIPRNMDPSPGHFAMRNVPLRYALEWAYDLKNYEIAGPEWIKVADRYDIIAKAGGPTADDAIETRDLNVYVLAQGKGEPKVKPASPDVPPRISGSGGVATFTNFPLSRLTFLLSRRLDWPVLDQTGLKGSFDYSVDISGLPGPRDNGEPISILVIDQVNKVPTAN